VPTLTAATGKRDRCSGRISPASPHALACYGGGQWQPVTIVRWPEGHQDWREHDRR